MTHNGTKTRTKLPCTVCDRTVLSGSRHLIKYGRVAIVNMGSIRVLEKCGFMKTRVEKAFANARGNEIEEVIYKLS